jgi:hypothetical protein
VIARYTWLDAEAVEAQLEEMRGLEIYDVHRKGGFDVRAGRLVTYRSRRSRAAKAKPTGSTTRRSQSDDQETSVGS